MSKHNQSGLEKFVESLIWKSRLVIILPVIFSIIGAVALFLTASYEIFQSVRYMDMMGPHSNYTSLIIHLITAVDQYLIGIVLLIFAFGIYELFISRIDEARAQEGDSVLDISSLDELKNKILKVVIMVLIVNLSKSVMTFSISSVLEILWLALSVLAMAACVFFVRNIQGEK